MIHLLRLIYMSVLLFFTADPEQNQPKRLNKKEEKPKKRIKKQINIEIVKKILFILIIIIAFLIIVYIVFKTGSLESTRYYNRFDKIV